MIRILLECQLKFFSNKTRKGIEIWYTMFSSLLSISFQLCVKCSVTSKERMNTYRNLYKGFNNSHTHL